MSVLRSSALRLVKIASSAADTVRRPAPGVVVLLYHRIGGRSGLQIDLDPARFADQLAELGDRVVPLARALDLLDGPAVDDRAPVVITFDDGSADVVEHAVPALVAAGAHATLYLATSFVEGGGGELPYGGRAVSWSALADACSTGHLAIGSHTHGHVLLDRIGVEEAVADIDRSIRLVETNLGFRPLDFAYPKAVAAAGAVEAVVRDRFRSAAIAGTRPNPYGGADRWRLHRSPVQVADGMRWFRAKAGGGMQLEDDLRRRLNRARYARATS